MLGEFDRELLFEEDERMGWAQKIYHHRGIAQGSVLDLLFRNVLYNASHRPRKDRNYWVSR